MRKKFLALMLSLSMVVSLSACGEKTENASSSQATETAAAEEADLSDIIPEGDPVTLTVYDEFANYSGEQVGWFAQILLDKFNVKLNIVPSTKGDGVFQTRMESGNLGDICLIGDADQYAQAVDQGLLWDWDEEDLLENYGPYIAENMSEAIQQNKDLNDGKCYGFGYDVGTSPLDIKSFDYHPDLRYDLYTQIGSPEITTLEDYADVLEQMVEICPTSDSGKQTYGVSLFPDWDGDMVMFVKATAALYGYEEFGIGLYDVNTQTYQGALDEDGMYLRCLKFYNDLYQRGLLDPDSSTQTFDNVTEDYTDGAAFMCIFDWLGQTDYNTDKHKAKGKAMLTVTADDAKTLVNGCNIYGGEYKWGIGANTEYPELCMAIINWLSTPEGNMDSMYGEKGYGWDYDENGNTEFTEIGRTAYLNHETELTGDFSGTFKDGMNQLNITTWALDASNPESNGETYNYLSWESQKNTEVSDIEQQWRDDMGASSEDDYLGNTDYSLVLGTTYTKPTLSDDLNITWNQVTTCIKEYSWKAIYAESDAEYEKLVQEMISKADEYGYQECQEFQQNEAKNRKAAEDEAKAVIDESSK